MMEANKVRMEEFRKTREKPFDKDGDGKLNDEERKAMMEAMQKRRPNAGPQFQEMMKKFDKDGDGKLNEEERKAMREARLNAPAQPKPAAPAAAAK
jgi:Ca2+-binding EF-hand superfamily protein